MSKGPDRFIRSGRVILGASAASVALLLGVWLVLPERAPAPEEVPAPVAEPFAGGVQPAGFDPARRELADDPGVDRIFAAAPLPETATVEDRIRSQADRPPPPPPDPAVMAAQDAAAAALPIAITELNDALDGRRSALRRACAKGRGADSSTLYITTTFAADGKLSEHSVTDDGTAPDVAACVQGQLASLTIPPPGVQVMARATLDLR